VGRALFEAVAAHARSKFAQRLEWQVLDWNAPAIGFYERLGADLDGKWLNGRLTAKALERMAPNNQEP
jgi:GNAT superfamily N-acetyltransferase